MNSLADGVTDKEKEVIAKVASELRRADSTADPRKADEIRYGARLIFDAHFPQPGICHCCGQKETHRKD